ncbi:hypothetical protein B0H67DRAFT_146429 [Lasiosphaeris hirsuta]|uniref:Secreted protein n=1 Tax=Lasiosphaeris hirsuta TaxID=260670 RepID=A0AA40B1T0_9PEZI|nr:hypothetical protein B0H67DRAFT_146429 [Lasiosphaeris hirsuta]
MIDRGLGEAPALSCSLLLVWAGAFEWHHESTPTDSVFCWRRSSPLSPYLVANTVLPRACPDGCAGLLNSSLFPVPFRS